MHKTIENKRCRDLSFEAMEKNAGLSRVDVGREPGSAGGESAAARERSIRELDRLFERAADGSVAGVSEARTRVAIVNLSQGQLDVQSIKVIFEENRDAIEEAIEKNLGVQNGPRALGMVLLGMARNARLYCHEAESADRWVERTAQLECRRAGYELGIKM